MTVIVSKPAVNLREELASLRNQGGYEEQQFYFDGLVTNGTFDTDTSGWTALSDAAIAQVGGAMRVTNGASGYATASQAITCNIGQRYKIIYSVSAPATTIPTRVIVDVDELQTSPFIASTAAAVTGTQTFEFVATATTHYLQMQVFTGTASVAMDFDNISVFETDGTDVVHRMPKGWVPLHVYEDGLLQREGAANDYEVVYDGFDYYVKPAVAPSATTQTCVIGVRK